MDVWDVFGQIAVLEKCARHGNWLGLMLEAPRAQRCELCVVHVGRIRPSCQSNLYGNFILQHKMISDTNSCYVAIKLKLRRSEDYCTTCNDSFCGGRSAVLMFPCGRVATARDEI